MSLPVLQVIIGSTRPGRNGEAIAKWFVEQAEAHGGFTVELVDLATFNLPVFNEPHHPRSGRYEHEATKQWAATIARADAYVFVIPEYNHSFNGAIKNAIDYLHNEWKYKVYGALSYGGASMGLRATQALKPVLTALRLFHAGDLPIPLMQTPVVDGVFAGNDVSVEAAKLLMDELVSLTAQTAALRAN